MVGRLSTAVRIIALRHLYTKVWMLASYKHHVTQPKLSSETTHRSDHKTVIGHRQRLLTFRAQTRDVRTMAAAVRHGRSRCQRLARDPPNVPRIVCCVRTMP